MIKKIYHTADWHLRCFKRHDEFKESINLLVNHIQSDGIDLKYNEAIICITGDLFDNKEEISNESTLLMGETLKQLKSIFPVMIIIGNHDISANKTRLDNISPIVRLIETDDKDEIIYYSKKSEIFIIDNIVFVHYCFLDNFEITCPAKERDKIYIGLYHDIIQNSKIPYDPFFEKRTKNKPNLTLFEGCDVVLMGDIHYPQVIKKDGLNAYYCGSLYQQNIGEPVNKHGFGIWNCETKEYTFVELNNAYGQYKMVLEDLDNFNPKILNII